MLRNPTRDVDQMISDGMDMASCGFDKSLEQTYF